ncbi:hypothetical protein F66182_18099 [Fusarium sp. NRRL 66182]|nr:hypothetical protein F66182_18099 [Fusarium sp. NRRL 66182]
MTTASNSNVGPAIYQQQLHISTLGLDVQEPLYQSPQDTCFNPDDYLPASTTSASIGGYTSAPMVNYTITTSPEAMSNGMMAGNNAAYMSRAAAMTAAQMQDNGNTYPPASYHYQ